MEVVKALPPFSLFQPFFPCHGNEVISNGSTLWRGSRPCLACPRKLESQFKLANTFDLIVPIKKLFTLFSKFSIIDRKF